MDALANKVVMITGASRGLGRAMAEGMAAAGAHLVLTARKGSEEKLAGVIRSIEAQGVKGKLVPVFGELTRIEDCEAVIGACRIHFGALDALVNNAGLGMDLIGPKTSEGRRFYNIDPDVWRRIIDANINGTFWMTRAAMPVFLGQRRGRIINVTTSFDTMVREGYCPYGPSKAAVEAMTAIWAKELVGTGITVNALLPGGAADTDMMPREDWPDRSKLISPSRMIAPAVWLASDESHGITGMRVVAKDWNPGLPPLEAFKAASAKAGTHQQTG